MEESEAGIGREETKQRRALAKAFGLAVKQQAKGTAWRCSQGVLFRDFDSWFISAPAAVWIGRRKTQIELKCKPMALDPIFWEIVETESNASMPLSFRYFGAWTCSTPALLEHELNETDPFVIATEALAWLDGQMGQFKSWSVEHFLQGLRTHPRANSYLATVVTTLFMIGNYEPAEVLCKDAIERGDAGGFSLSRQSGPSQSFPQLALAWLNRRRRSIH
jgi:hypothetical protein